MTHPTSGAVTPRTADLECLARRLERTGSYKVLRRLEPRISSGVPDTPGTRLGLFVDVETTGLDVGTDEVIELALVPFRYTLRGEIASVGEPISQLQQPSRPIPAKIVQLTGITDDAVAGRSIDGTLIAPLIARRPLVVAHNASFDRDFVEALLPDFANLPWACSMADVPWREEGATTLKLSVLAADAGFFYDAHRATDDCLAAIELLRRPLPRSGRLAFAELLRAARRDTFRVMAVSAPYEARAVLKGRGYRWQEGGYGRPKCWYRMVDEDDLELECAWLREEIYGSAMHIPTARLTAWTRYSSRA